MTTGFIKLLEISDKVCREELDVYYVVSESRMNKYLQCLEDGAKEIKKLRADVERLQELNTELIDALEKAVMYLAPSGWPVGFDYRCDRLVAKARGEVNDG